MTAPPPFEYLVRTALLADPGIAAVVGARCYPVRRLENGVLPCLVYTVVNDPLLWGCWSEAYLQVSAMAERYDTARRLEIRVRTVLDTLAVDNPGIEIAGIDTNLPGFRTYEPDTGVYHHAVDALVTYIYR